MTQMKNEKLINKIDILDKTLYYEFSKRVKIDPKLTRQLVSFQANKKVPLYRWYKFKEGFSNDLVKYYIKYNGPENTYKVFDPFAGSGTTLFTSSSMGIDSTGIELLPIGIEIIETRKTLLTSFSKKDFQTLEHYVKNTPWVKHKKKKNFIEMPITEKAYSAETKKLIEKYLDLIEKENPQVNKVLQFVLLCVLESISYTRKDGQYLRWDHRANRVRGSKTFSKGKIENFNSAITNKLSEIIEDSLDKGNLLLFEEEKAQDPGKIELIPGSSLEELPKLESDQFDLVVTSPPYANRYDYTRTYALEIAMLGTPSEELNKLRQTMLSCTVENKEKDLIDLNPNWKSVIQILEGQDLLQNILEYLNYKKETKTLNNNGIPRMLKGYFYELACIIYELHRILKPNGAVVMVNDNVKYAGVSISVDLILSKIAQDIGFEVEQISILPNGKGNSSQQMGEHGREALRKCVYIWRKK